MPERILPRFLDYVEIRTKTASLLPFLLGLAYAWHAYGTLDGRTTAVFFLSMICFDMMTTALNNYIDTKTNGMPLPFARPLARRILIVLLSLAVVFGLLLVLLLGPARGVVVLAAGAFCFAIGIVYTYGPAPISRLPLGEAFSGFVMGFFIPFLIVYVNAPADRLAFVNYSDGLLQASLRLPDLLRLALLTIVPIACIANIMLANNTCDIEHDRPLGRRTLPICIGVRRSLWLFAAIYAVAFLAIAALPLFGVLPPYAALTLLAAIPVYRNVRAFAARQSKRQTFVLSVRNMILIMLPLIVLTAV